MFGASGRHTEQQRRMIPSDSDGATKLLVVAGQGRAVVDFGAFDQLAQRVRFTRSELQELDTEADLIAPAHQAGHARGAHQIHDRNPEREPLPVHESRRALNESAPEADVGDASLEVSADTFDRDRRFYRYT